MSALSVVVIVLLVLLGVAVLVGIGWWVLYMLAANMKD